MEHKKQWEFLENKFKAGQLGHAYLFSGQDGIDLKTIAKEFVKLINGNSATHNVNIEKEQFPDLMVVRSINSKSSIDNEKDMMEIDVAQIRDVNNFLSLKSYYGGYKVVIIEDADRMNTDSADSFLKNLEEPKGQTLIVLLSTKPSTLLPTIFSRCQTITFFGAKQALELPENLKNILEAELSEKFKYAKAVNLDGGNFENILHALQNYWRKDINKYRNVLKLALDFERQAQISNINKKLALEILLMQIN